MQNFFRIWNAAQFFCRKTCFFIIIYYRSKKNYKKSHFGVLTSHRFLLLHAPALCHSTYKLDTLHSKQFTIIVYSSNSVPLEFFACTFFSSIYYFFISFAHTTISYTFYLEYPRLSPELNTKILAPTLLSVLSSVTPVTYALYSLPFLYSISH